MLVKLNIKRRMMKYDFNYQNKVKNAYTIDHTIITYLMDDENKYLTFLGSNLNEHDLASNIVENILKS